MKVFLLLLLLTCSISYGSERLSRSPHHILKQNYETVPWIFDPFYGSESQFSVTAIISGKMAFVNRHWVHLGQKLGIFTITRIERTGVRLENGFAVVTLPIKK